MQLLFYYKEGIYFTFHCKSIRDQFLPVQTNFNDRNNLRKCIALSANYKQKRLAIHVRYRSIQSLLSEDFFSKLFILLNRLFNAIYFVDLVLFDAKKFWGLFWRKHFPPFFHYKGVTYFPFSCQSIRGHFFCIVPTNFNGQNNLRKCIFVSTNFKQKQFVFRVRYRSVQNYFKKIFSELFLLLNWLFNAYQQEVILFNFPTDWKQASFVTKIKALILFCFNNKWSVC